MLFPDNCVIEYANLLEGGGQGGSSLYLKVIMDNGSLDAFKRSIHLKMKEIKDPFEIDCTCSIYEVLAKRFPWWNTKVSDVDSIWMEDETSTYIFYMKPKSTKVEIFIKRDLDKNGFSEDLRNMFLKK